MKKEKKIKKSSKASQDNKEFFVDVYDDDLMVELGFRCPTLAPRDPSIYEKTPNEIRLLKLFRNEHKEKIHFHSSPIKPIPVRAKLIIQLKRNNKFSKSTYSIECYMHEIDNILSNYYQWNNKNQKSECLIVKYSYNGKTYKPEERPFWPGK